VEGRIKEGQKYKIQEGRKGQNYKMQRVGGVQEGQELKDEGR
jgi:hypothetical protein